MATIGYHASHEQFPPSALLRYVCAAQDAGFQAAMCSDHWAPWSVRQGHSGYAWSWLGAAMHATQLSFGVVTAPGQRYHPAVLAQAIATLAEMFPGRLWAALGSGEALNEHITGDPWPDKPVRDARWDECADVMRRLLAGDEVTHEGLVHVHRARLWSRPPEAPPLWAAAVSPASARRAAAWADGLVTVRQAPETMRAVIDAFREGGGRGPVAVQAHLSWHEDESRALAIAHQQWRTNVFGGLLAWELALPEQFDAAARHVRPDDVRESVLVGNDLGWHLAALAEIAELGVDAIYLHDVGLDQERFIEAFGAKVVAELAAVAAS